MKKTTKRILAMAMVATSALTTSACGGDGRKSGGNTLWVTVNNANYEKTIFNKLKNAFVQKMADEGRKITVKYNTYGEGSYTENIMKYISSGTIGDVVYAYDESSGNFLKEKYFVALDDYIAKDQDLNLANYSTDILDSARTYNGKLAYFPKSFDQMITFINVDMMTELGLQDEIPTAANTNDWADWTWEKLLELCATIKENIKTTYDKQADYYYPLAMRPFYQPIYDPIVKSFGGYSVDGVALKSGFDANNTEVYPKTKKAIEFLNDLVDNGYTEPGEGSFSGGYDAITFAVRPSVISVKNAQMNVAFAPLPKFTDSITGLTGTTTYVGYGSSGYAISADSRNKSLAWEFIKFCVGEEGQAITAESGACIPVIKSQFNTSAKWTEYLKDEFGNVIDQSAFVYDGLTRSLATYARGVDVKTEYEIYNQTKQILLTSLDKKTSVSDIMASIYNATKTYIKK